MRTDGPLYIACSQASESPFINSLKNCLFVQTATGLSYRATSWIKTSYLHLAKVSHFKGRNKGTTSETADIKERLLILMENKTHYSATHILYD
jgi:hypothetical protein